MSKGEGIILGFAVWVLEGGGYNFGFCCLGRGGGLAVQRGGGDPFSISSMWEFRSFLERPIVDHLLCDHADVSMTSQIFSTSKLISCDFKVKKCAFKFSAWINLELGNFIYISQSGYHYKLTAPLNKSPRIEMSPERRKTKILSHL